MKKLTKKELQKQVSELKGKLRDMAEWKDSAYQTIQEIADEAFGKSWSGGKTQDEIIGRVKWLRENLEQYQTHAMEVGLKNLKNDK